MSNVFAELEVNPFEDDVVTEPRRISFSVKGLNDKPLEHLIARFRGLTEGALPRAHPLKVFGQAERSKALIDWIKSRIHDPAVMQKLTGLLKKRGIDLVGREAAWLKVLAGYAFSDADSLERDAGLKWLRGDPLEA